MKSYLGVFWKYAVFYGRASRREFWMFALIHVVVIGALAYFGGVALDKEIFGATMPTPGAWLTGFYLVLSFLPFVCLIIRRLHDTNRSGWWVLLGGVSYALVPVGIGASNLTVLVPTILGILLILGFCTERGHSGDNDYGADPSIDSSRSEKRI
jgi:uncharacterized membrane protein YhaH (DUF805 family)